MSKKRRQAPPPEPSADEATVSILPVEVQVGDLLTDEPGEWEVVTHPAALYAGKSLHARLRKVGEPTVVEVRDLAGS